MHKLIADFLYDEDGKIKQFLGRLPPTPWYVVDTAEDGTSIQECPTKQDAEDLIKAFHEEGSHTDHDFYEIFHNGKKYGYTLKVIIK